MSDSYEWYSQHNPPFSKPTGSWNEAFGQRKAHLAKQWDNASEHRRKVLIEKVVYYSSIHEIQEL